MCLRKGCGRRYQPRRWNQRYCRDPECLRQLRRWQAAQRQARRRQDDAIKAQHAAAERARRRNVRGVSVRAVSVRTCQRKQRSRSRLRRRVVTQQKFFVDSMCVRPGCYESATKLGRNQRRYCGSVCCQAVRQVLDRERKWVQRGTLPCAHCTKKNQAAAASLAKQPNGTARLTPPRPPPP